MSKITSEQKRELILAAFQRVANQVCSLDPKHLSKTLKRDKDWNVRVLTALSPSFPFGDNAAFYTSDRKVPPLPSVMQFHFGNKMAHKGRDPLCSILSVTTDRTEDGIFLRFDVKQQYSPTGAMLASDAIICGAVMENAARTARVLEAIFRDIDILTHDWEGKGDCCAGHCCTLHGCKYGYDSDFYENKSCSVVSGVYRHSSPCPYCHAEVNESGDMGW